jgi:hypothetical protein
MSRTKFNKWSRTKFNKWFTHLLYATESCLMRDVLRNQKENLWAEWVKVDPVGERALQDPGGDSNPIRLEDGKWWWYDEVWVSRNGPYDTKEAAAKDLDQYVKENL